MPSHSGRGGGDHSNGGFHGGGPGGPGGPGDRRGGPGGPGGHGGGELLGGIIGGIIGGAIESKRRRNYGPPPPDGPHDRPPESRVYTKRSGRAGLYVFLIVLMIGFAIVAFSVGSIAKSTKNDIADAKTNITQIEKESEDFELLLSGDSSVTNIGTAVIDITSGRYRNPFESYSSNPKTPGFYHWEDNGDRSYYFMVYSVNITGSNHIFTTYASFNDSDIEDSSVSVTYGKLNGKWISINSNYSIDDNFEYDFRKSDLASKEKTYSTLNTIRCILFAIVGLIFVIFIISIVKGVKKRKNEKVVEDAMDKAEYSRIQADIAESKSKINKAEEEIKSRNRYCQFCGSKIPENSHKCPNCGANLEN